MNYWLLKTEPDTYSWDRLVKEKKAVWDGIRNFQARKNLKAMKKGDIALIYHTGNEKAVIGLAKVVKEHYPEPADPEWSVVEISPEKKLKKAITLAQIKADKRLSNMVLVRAPRLSVQPVSEEEFSIITRLGED